MDDAFLRRALGDFKVYSRVLSVAENGRRRRLFGHGGLRDDKRLAAVKYGLHRREIQEVLGTGTSIGSAIEQADLMRRIADVKLANARLERAVEDEIQFGTPIRSGSNRRAVRLLGGAMESCERLRKEVRRGLGNGSAHQISI